MAESEEELKNLLMRVKEESEKADWKLSFKKYHGILSHHFIRNKRIKWKQWQILFSWAQKLLLMVTSAITLKTLAPWKEIYDKSRQHIKKQRHQFANKSPYSQKYDFTSSHVQMWDLYHKEDWAPKNWCFWIVMLEKTWVCWSARRWNQSIIKESILNIHWKDWSWNWDSNTLATWCEEPFHRKSP